MLKYGVLFVDGDDVTGGGSTLENKIAAGAMTDPRVPGDECAASGDDHAAPGDDDHVTTSGDDGDAAAMQAMHAGHPRTDTDQQYFTADEGSTWQDICLQAGVHTDEEQRSYFTWLKRFRIGNRNKFRMDGVFMPCPFRARADHDRSSGSLSYEELIENQDPEVVSLTELK